MITANTAPTRGPMQQALEQVDGKISAFEDLSTEAHERYTYFRSRVPDYMAHSSAGPNEQPEHLVNRLLPGGADDQVAAYGVGLKTANPDGAPGDHEANPDGKRGAYELLQAFDGPPETDDPLRPLRRRHALTMFRRRYPDLLLIDYRGAPDARRPYEDENAVRLAWQETDAIGVLRGYDAGGGSMQQDPRRRQLMRAGLPEGVPVIYEPGPPLKWGSEPRPWEWAAADAGNPNVFNTAYFPVLHPDAVMFLHFHWEDVKRDYEGSWLKANKALVKLCASLEEQRGHKVVPCLQGSVSEVLESTDPPTPLLDALVIHGVDYIHIKGMRFVTMGWVFEKLGLPVWQQTMGDGRSSDFAKINSGTTDVVRAALVERILGGA